jgi:lipoyl(octanoyl) transferase
MRARTETRSTGVQRELVVHRLGRVEYEDGLKLQRLVVEARSRDLIPDTLLLLEHPPVLTLGRAANRTNILVGPERLRELGVEVFETNRGGDVTYHGPGQIVGYPIFRLSPDRQDVRRYVRNVEESLIRALGRFGISATRVPAYPGVWVGADPDRAVKIGAIGVHLSRWLTSHGFALNVNTDLSHFDLIVPCGIERLGVTSMQRELGCAVDLAKVERELSNSFAEVFDARLQQGQVSLKTISVAVLRKRDGQNQVLLLRRRRERGGFWQIVTGRIDPRESALEAARRELTEETGFELPVEDLGYRHAFALGEEVPPQLVEETAFAAWQKREQAVRLNPDEHDALEWLPVPAALEQLRFPGLRNAVLWAVAAR